MFDAGLLERHCSHIYGQDYGWDEIYYDTDDTNDSYYNNNPVDFGGRHGWQSQKLLRIEDGKFIARDLANELFAQKASISYLEPQCLKGFVQSRNLTLMGCLLVIDNSSVPHTS